MSLAKMIRKLPMFKNIDRMEEELYARKDVIHPAGDSPERFEIMREKIKRGGEGPPSRMAFIMIPTVMGITESLKTLKDNPEKPRTHAEDGALDEVRSLAFRMGASSMGYTKVSPSWVFRNKAISYENAIVFAMEMDKPSIDTAPSLACMKTVMETYRDQGRIANKIASLLRKRGFGAHAGHPLMGLALYPPMAQSAGLGWMGLNGIIITSEHGPRVRLAAVFTSIENLPFANENEHDWIEGYCHSCRVCIKECPPHALYVEPVLHDSGRLTYVENELCFPYFDDYYGCSVCVKVCPFNHVAYEKLRTLRTHQ
jgi:NAD-dependent dihydropyrimidine dehydrogenase PreA subunit